MFSNVLKAIDIARLTASELQRLLKRFASSVLPTTPHVSLPIYNKFQLAKVIDEALLTYRKDWSADELQRYQYKIIEALTNWVGNALRDGYPKRNLILPKICLVD